MLQLASKKRLRDEARSGYATHSDFCAIFLQHLDRLYLLALILTGDEVSAEKCLLTALDLCVQEGSVFKGSVVAWSRRSVIKNAIRLTLPVPGIQSHPYPIGNRSGLSLDKDVSLKCVQEMSPFDRFVFVMSVLERYSDRDCALLLGCSSTDILPARIRALQQISGLEKSHPVHSSGTQPYVINPDWLECG